MHEELATLAAVMTLFVMTAFTCFNINRKDLAGSIGGAALTAILYSFVFFVVTYESHSFRRVTAYTCTCSCPDHKEAK